MFFVHDDGVLRETTLKPGDRIRVRPGLGKWFVWRPVAFGTGFSWLSIFRRFRRATRLWVPDGAGGYRQWLDLPSRGKGDALQRILETYGRDNFHPPGITDWREEARPYAVDERFDYVAR